MNLVKRPAPHVRHTDSITISMADALIALIPCLVMGAYYLGSRLLVNCALAVVTALAAELLTAIAFHRRPTIGDLSAVVTALIIGMLLPVGIVYRYVVMATLAAILVAKGMFGGVGKNIFNPALVGVALVTLVNTPAMGTVYTGGTFPLWGDVPAGMTPAVGILSQLKTGEELTTSLFDAFVGRQAAVPAGVCIPVLLVSGAYLLYRRILSPQITLSAVVTVAVLAMIFQRAGDPLLSAGLELTAGSLLFCTVFCMGDPVTTPNTAPGQILFGVSVGLLTMLIRTYGRYDEGVVFAVLIMNSASFVLDKFIHRIRKQRKGETTHVGQQKPEA